MALDFVAGCVGGCAGVIVGHPLDTVKIHIQMQSATTPTYRGTLHCLQTVYLKDGMRGIYRGMSSPLFGVAAINAIVFGIYGNTQKLLNQDKLSSHFVAGATAGFCQSFFCSPMELAKSRMQLDSTLPSPTSCLRKILREQGIRGVFKGLPLTILREVPAFGCYFWTYEFLTRTERGGPVSTAAMLTSGGIAGVVSWVVVYPVDVLKTRMQVANYPNSMECLRRSVESDGWKCLYRGLTPTVVRAFPVNAATFAVVNWTMRLLEEETWGRCRDAIMHNTTLKLSRFDKRRTFEYNAFE